MCIFMPKMHQNTFGGQAPPGPVAELKRSPRPSSRNQGAPTSKGEKERREEGEGKRRKVKGRGGRGKERERQGREGREGM